MSKKNKPTIGESAGMSRRSLNFQFRSQPKEGSEERTISGHGSVFESLSQDLGGFREIIHAGAFDAALSVSDPFCLFNHNADWVLGRSSNGTLRLSVDDTGLAYECDMPDTPWANGLQVLLDRGDITQSSFAFSMDWEDERTSTNPDGAYEWEYSEERGWLLHIYRVTELFDVSPVTYPAYKAADVRQARSAFGEVVERAEEAKKAKEQEEQAAAQRAAADNDYITITMSLKDEHYEE